MPNGLCRLCGSVGKLSLEHVPPRSAFNATPVFLRTMEDWLQGDDRQRRGRKEQRGFGAFTLCERCNNNTGSWYGGEYVEWARALGPQIYQRPTELREVTLSLHD